VDRPDFQLACDVVFDVMVDGLDTRRVQVLVATTLFEAGVEPDDRIEMSVSMCDEQRIAEMNLEHREVDGPTDVLSFPIDGLHDRLGPDEPRALGDLLVCPVYVERQIADDTTMQGDATLVAALERCIVHGVLHLCDFDHERSDEDAEEMFALEQLVLDRVRGTSGS
jgi:probable rRNA maturation factor